MSPEPGKPADKSTQVLDQSEIDRLMMEATAEADLIVYRPDGSRYESAKKVHIDSCDFRNPVFLTEIELRQVRIRHEAFIHYLSARLSMFLRMDFGMKMAKLYTAPYAKFTENIPNPTYISLFSIEQLTGVGIIDVSPRLAMTIVNRMLGGAGHSIQNERYLTEIEMGLMDDIINITLDEWCSQWEDFRELNATLVGRESNGRFLQTAPSDAIMLVLQIEATLGDCSEPVQLAVPYYLIEPIIREMQNRQSRHVRSRKTTEKKAQWLPNYSEITVPVQAEWEAFELSVNDLLNLRAGDVLELPREMLENTLVRLRNMRCFRGETGVRDGHVAIKIHEKIHVQPEE